jgi:diguanylate cyclase (GGDEF)-like protein
MVKDVLSRVARKAESRLIQILVLTGLALVAIVFAYTVLFRLVTVSEKVSAGLGNILADDMLHNEDLADVISLFYFRLNHAQPPFSTPAMEHDPQHNIYGANLFADTPSPNFQGTLQSRRELPRQAVLIARSIDLALDHEDRVPHHHLVVRRYFLPVDNDYIYLYTKMPTRDYVFASYGGKGFILKGEGKTRNYFTQKLNNTVETSAGKFSAIYQDVLTKRPTLSIEHFVYDIGDASGNTVLGVACIDYELNTFIQLIDRMGYTSGERYLNIDVEDKLKHSHISILNNGYAFGSTSFEINKRYVFTVSVNPWAFYLSANGYPDILIFLLLVAVVALLGRAMFKHKQAAQTDPLTSLYNRKWLLAWEKHRGKHDGYIVALIDCNRFKPINDKYGHAMGDDALKFIAASIQQNIRSGYDYAVRMGGDEFVILFRTRNVAGAYEAMVRINAQLQQFGHGISLSVSYGFAPLNNDTPLIAAIAEADKRMYRYKKGKGSEYER